MPYLTSWISYSISASGILDAECWRKTAFQQLQPELFAIATNTISSTPKLNLFSDKQLNKGDELMMLCKC